MTSATSLKPESNLSRISIPLFCFALGACGGEQTQAPVEAPTIEKLAAAKAKAAKPWVLTGPYGAIERHDNDYIRMGDRFYLIGGRNLRNGHIEEYMRGEGPAKPVQSYDPKTNKWTTLAEPPRDLHHFQGAIIGSKVYVISGQTGVFPNEAATERVYSYDVENDKWTDEGDIPEARRRGSTATAVVDGKIYIVGGSNGGHSRESHALAWVDSYDPATKTWEKLADAPHPRQHFQAVVRGNEIYAIAGRKHGATVKGHVDEVDVYDVSTGTWRTLPPESNIPTPRSGAAAVLYGNEAVIIGGQNSHLTKPTVEALNLDTHEWRTLPPLLEGRHGVGGVVCGSGIYVAAGAGTLGGHSQFTSHEAIEMDASKPSCSDVLLSGGQE